MPTGAAAATGGGLHRRISAPTCIQRTKSVLKYATADESLHSTYGSERGAEGDKDSRRVTLTDIRIREYNRTVGDNPSCSSGPPVS